MPPGGMGSRDARAAVERRARFIDHFAKHGDLRAAAKHAGVTLDTYRKWRVKWPDFAAMVDSIKAQQFGRRKRPPPGENRPGPASRAWDGRFATFREVFLGRSSPWYHVQAADVLQSHIDAALANADGKLEDISFGGKIIMFLWPPEHGKTSWWEDFDTFALCKWPWFRITVGSERVDHSKKVVNFVRGRFEHDAPGMAYLRERFGPFAPPRGQRTNQTWGSTAFDVLKKPRGLYGERDYSMAAIGMGGAIIGTRCNLLQVDDPQSRKSLGKTAELVDVFRQDWLSRPGPHGLTVILGNRVGEEDFYEELEDEGIVDEIIRVPAWHPERGWAWPERYSEDDYERMRRRVGEDAWERNYMQVARPAKSRTFPDDVVASRKDPTRSIIHAPPSRKVVVTFDPGFSRCGIMPAAWDHRAVHVLEAVEGIGLGTVEQQLDLLEETLHSWNRDGAAVERVIIETKNFQRGFLTHPRMVEMGRRFGFRLVPFETGADKNDPDIGVAALRLALERAEIDFPDADPPSRRALDPLYRDMRRWRPEVRGNKLEQDLLMCLWFHHRHWREWVRMARGGGFDPSAWRRPGLPSPLVTSGRG